tara:strand:- start:219 stop:467 length:249 start_codon:yes stop_codon:yes gene_type:complete
MHVLPEGGTHAIDQGRNFVCCVFPILHGRSGHLCQFIFHLSHGIMFQTQEHWWSSYAFFFKAGKKDILFALVVGIASDDIDR